MSQSRGFAAYDAITPLKPFDFVRRPVGTSDVAIEVLYCGVCHSDIHTARSEWPGTVYPVVPGHEIVGRVTHAGTAVEDFKAGDLVGVGCLVDSCQRCASCANDLEQYCENGGTFTYNSPDPHTGKVTYGGYSDQIVVDRKFVLKVSDKLDIKAVAPLLCAGITTYSPLRHWNVRAGQRVGIIGLGGLGHMGVKFAKAMGATVVMITTSPQKGEDAKMLGAHEVLISKDIQAMQAAANSFDFLLNTIPTSHDLKPYVSLLKCDGVMVIVGAVEMIEHGIDGGALIFQRKSIAGSLIGGIKETQEMLDFCEEKNIVSDVEMIHMQDINTAYERMLRSDVKYRFVIDMTSLKDQKSPSAI